MAVEAMSKSVAFEDGGAGVGLTVFGQDQVRSARFVYIPYHI